MKWLMVVVLIIFGWHNLCYAWGNDEDSIFVEFQDSPDTGIHSSQFLKVMHAHTIMEISPKYNDAIEFDGFLDAGSPSNPYVIEYKDSTWHEDTED